MQNWVSNTTLDGSCTNLTGGKPNQAGYPPNTGSLFRGMIQPLVNMSIRGATWFQGENNCAECAARCGPADPKTKHPKDCDITANATVCGNVLERSGYPCYLLAMIREWRAAWSAVPNTTDAEFPFGIQTLQSTEGSCGNGAFRWAQALNEATLPSP